MWSQFSAAALAAMRTGQQAHTAPSKVEVWHSGSPAAVLSGVFSGGVSADENRSVRRNLSCSLVDPTGALSRGEVNDLLNAYQCEVAVFRGVVAPTTSDVFGLIPTAGFGLQPFGTSSFGGAGVGVLLDNVTTYATEYAPHGVFQLTSKDVRDSPDGLVISLDGQDRTMRYQGPMSSALAVQAGTPIETAIQMLLSTRNPGLTMRAMVTGFTTGPLLYSPDINVWDEAADLAKSVGAALFHDRTGQCVLAAPGPASDSPASYFAEGDGLLLSISRKEDSDTIVNVVVVESASGLVRAVAADMDPSSPTYALGSYGWRPGKPIVSQHVGSPDQAMQAANARLIYELGRSETGTFEAVPDASQDVQEMTNLHRPRSGFTYRTMAVSTYDMPLGVEESMRVGCRRSVLTPDGAVLPVTSL